MSNSADDPLEHLRREREREYEQVPLGEPEDLARVIRTINDRLRSSKSGRPDGQDRGAVGCTRHSRA
jgi:hypothetical protein